MDRDGESSGGPRVYTGASPREHPLFTRWKEEYLPCMSEEEGYLDTLSREDLHITEPKIRKNGEEVWFDPREGQSPAPIKEPWPADHYNVIVGDWRPPYRPDLKPGGTIPLDYKRWVLTSYVSSLCWKFIGGGGRMGSPLVEGVMLYKAATKPGFWTVDELQKMAGAKLLFYKDGSHPRTLKGLLSSECRSKLKKTLKRMDKVTMPLIDLSNFNSIALMVYGNTPITTLRHRSHLWQLSVELILGQLDKIREAERGYFHSDRASIAALHGLASISSKITEAQKEKYFEVLWRHADAISGEVFVSEEGLSLSRYITRNKKLGLADRLIEILQEMADSCLIYKRNEMFGIPNVPVV